MPRRQRRRVAGRLRVRLVAAPRRRMWRRRRWLHAQPPRRGRLAGPRLARVGSARHQHGAAAGDDTAAAAGHPPQPPSCDETAAAARDPTPAGPDGALVAVACAVAAAKRAAGLAAGVGRDWTHVLSPASNSSAPAIALDHRLLRGGLLLHDLRLPGCPPKACDWGCSGIAPPSPPVCWASRRLQERPAWCGTSARSCKRAAGVRRQAALFYTCSPHRRGGRHGRLPQGAGAQRRRVRLAGDGPNVDMRGAAGVVPTS